MSVKWRTVTGPGNRGYEIRAGSAVALTAPDGEPTAWWDLGGDDMGSMAWDSVMWLRRKLYWRRRGMLMVTTETAPRRWVWTTPRKRGAVALLDKVAHLLAAGEWVPGLTSPPELPGATVFSHGSDTGRR